jgi:hypothetical protein
MGGRTAWAAFSAMVAATLVGGCSIVGGAGAAGGAGGTGGSCGDIPSGACTEIMERAAAAHPGTTGVDVECVGSCTRAGGAGTVTITLKNGSTMREPFSYTGDPGPIPPPVCINIAQDVCRSLARSQAEDVSPSKGIGSVTVTCTKVPCRSDKGEATVDLTLRDGSTQHSTTNWDGGLP